MDQLDFARRLIELSDFEGATKGLISFLKANPNDIHAWFLLADAVQEPSKKADCYRRVLRLDPHNSRAQQLLRALGGEPHGAALPASQAGPQPPDNRSPHSISEPNLLLPPGGEPGRPKDPRPPSSSPIPSIITCLGGAIAAFAPTLPFVMFYQTIDEYEYTSVAQRGYETTAGILILLGALIIFIAPLALSRARSPAHALVPTFVAALVLALSFQQMNASVPEECGYELVAFFLSLNTGQRPDSSCYSRGDGPTIALIGSAIALIGGLLLVSSTRGKNAQR